MKVCKLIHVYGMLHNICKDRNIYIPLDEGLPEDDDVAIDQGREEVPSLPAGWHNAVRTVYIEMNLQIVLQVSWRNLYIYNCYWTCAAYILQ